MWDQGDIDPVREAAAYVDPEQGVETPQEALAGARNIMAEWVSEDTTARAQLRELFLSQGVLVSRVVKGKETLASKYRDYHNWEEPVATAPSHRVLAMMRGAGESLLTLHMSPPEEQARSILEGLFVRGDRTRFASGTGGRPRQLQAAAGAVFGNGCPSSHQTAG
jgi:uncharacterized protein